MTAPTAATGATAAALKIGYARVSTDAQDLTAQRGALAALGVEEGRVYVDHGMTGTNRARPGCARPWPRAAQGTCSWSPSWTASPVPCPTPATSSTSSPPAGCA